VITDQRAEAGGQRLHVLQVDGPGVPVVLLHGVSDSAEGYRPVLEHLAGRHPARAISFRGHGGSAHAASYALADYCADVVALIEADGPVVLAGHSLGSVVAAQLASSRPELVAGLLVEDSPLLALCDPARADAPWFDGFRRTRQLLTAPPDDDDAFLAAVGELPVGAPGSDVRMRDVASPRFLALRARVLRLVDPHVFDPILDAALVPAALPDALAAIACPTAIIAGGWANGGAMTAADLVTWQRRIPQATVTVLEQVGHVIHLGPTPVRIAYLKVLDELLDRAAQRDVRR
jgi:pimeloyl-ACP methyl ester carboxylesterase